MSEPRDPAPYTLRELAEEARRQAALHRGDGAKILEGLREPLQRILTTDLSGTGVPREGNHIDESRYLYYDGEMSITFDHLPKDKDIPPHDHGVWEAMAIYSGRLRHTVWDRTDDGTRDGYAELEAIENLVVDLEAAAG